MRAIAILLLALSSMSMATTPGRPIIAWVRPIETIGGHLVTFTDNETVVTVDSYRRKADTNLTVVVRYVNLRLSQIDTLDITPIMNPLLDSREKWDRFLSSSFAMSPNGKFIAMRLDQEGSVAVIRLDSLSLISSFKEETVRNNNYNSDVAILLSDDLTIALNNEIGGTTFLDGRSGSIIRTDPDSRMAVDRSLSPDSSTTAECSGEDLIGELVDIRGRWRIRLSDSGCVIPTYSPDGRYLASMNVAYNTTVWDLSPFPPHNPVSGEVILVDSLGLPLEGLEVMITTSNLKPFSVDSVDYLRYFHATTNRRGSIPMVVPVDGRYDFSTLYEWEDFELPKLIDEYPRTRWNGIPLRTEIPFTLKLTVSGGVSYQHRGMDLSLIRPWEITGQRVHRADVEIQVDGVETYLELYDLPDVLGDRKPDVAEMVVVMRRSGDGSAPAITQVNLDSTGRAAFTMSDSLPVTGGYSIAMLDPLQHYRVAAIWNRIPISEGRRHSFRLPIGGLPVTRSIPTTLKKVGGDAQQGPGGELLADPLVVSLLDQDGAPLPGAVVTFAVGGEGGTLSVVSDTTDAEGRAATTLTLGEELGTYTVIATVEDLEPVTFTVTAKSSPDFDGDGEVGFGDFYLFAEAFGGSDARFDLDGDGTVDFADFFLFAESFDQPARAKLAAMARERIGLPEVPELQNAPNPFNSGTLISWFQLLPGAVRLEVFALTGQRVAVLHEGAKEAGLHRLRWNGRDEWGRPLASGVYVYRLVTREAVQTRKLTLLR